MRLVVVKPAYLKNTLLYIVAPIMHAYDRQNNAGANR